MPFTPEDIAALVSALEPTITKVANEAAAAHVTQRNQAYDKRLSPLLEKFEKLNPAPQEDEEKLTLKEEMKRIREQLAQEKSEKIQLNLHGTIKSLLAQAKIPAHQIDALTAQLVYSDKLVSSDKEGNPVFNVSKFEAVALDEGLTNWLKDKGKAWLPQPQGKGTGQKNQRTTAYNPPSYDGQLPDADASQEEKDTALAHLVRSYGR